MNGYWTECREIVELVTDYLEGALRLDVRLAFEEHLTACPPCREYLEQVRETIRLAGRLRESRLSPLARQDLMSAFRSRS